MQWPRPEICVERRAMPRTPRARRRSSHTSRRTSSVRPPNAIKAARAAAPDGEGERVGRIECRWQRDQLPEAIRELVLDDQRLRNDICWSVFHW
jgi:hypothetical protein